MKVILTILKFNALVTFGQTKSDTISCHQQLDTLTKQEVYINVDKAPNVQGGFEELAKQTSKRMKYRTSMVLQGQLK